MADRGFSINIFLPDGSADSPRLIEKSNWTGKAVACTRGQYPMTRTRREFDGPGVYVLFGPTDDPSRKRVYIGESDSSRDRINNHLKEKEFWENVILFTSKDDSLNKAHTRYIEARLIAVAKDANRAVVENGNVPPAPPLSESEAAFADTFCDEMLSIYRCSDLRRLSLRHAAHRHLVTSSPVRMRKPKGHGSKISSSSSRVL